MKKIIILLAIAIIGTASFAATPKAVPKAAPKAAPAEASGELAVGTDLGFPTIRYSFNKDFSGQLGAMNASGGGASSTAILVKADYNLEKMGQAQPTIGAFYATNGAATAITSIGITWGIGTMVASNLKLGADIILLNSVTTGGTSVTGILGPGAVGVGVPGVINTVSIVASYTL